MNRVLCFAFFALTLGCDGSLPPAEPSCPTAEAAQVPCATSAVADPPLGPEPLTPEEIELVKVLEPMARGGPVAEDDITSAEIRQQNAHRWLGKLYFEKRDYKKAHEHFAAWVPWSGCGTCWIGLREERERAVLRCRLHRGEHVEVAHELRNSIKSGPGDAERAMLLFRLYREAGQTDDLITFFKGIDAAKNDAAIKYLLEVEELVVKKDVAALIARCHDSRDFPIDFDWNRAWKCRVAADALVGLLAGDTAPVLKALEKPTGHGNWLIYALGKSGAKDALKWLTERARTTDSDCERESVMYALALHGKAGRQSLLELKKLKYEIARDAEQRLRQLPDNGLGRGVADRMWQLDLTTLLERPWPQPKKGSLPR